jgi:hypothetical protein
MGCKRCRRPSGRGAAEGIAEADGVPGLRLGRDGGRVQARGLSSFCHGAGVEPRVDPDLIGDAVLVLPTMLARTAQGLRRRVLALRLRRAEQERQRVERLPAPASRVAMLARAHRLEALCVRCARLRYLVGRLQPTPASRARLAQSPGRSAP